METRRLLLLLLGRLLAGSGVYRLITTLTTGNSARCWRLSQRRRRRELIDSNAELLCDGTSNNLSTDSSTRTEREGDWQRRVRNRSIPSSFAAAASSHL